MSVSHTQKATSRGVRSIPERPDEITLGMTPEMAAVLDDLSEKMDAPVDEVLSLAVGLLMLAVKARERGQRVCFADDDGNVVAQIVDFGIEGDWSEDGTTPEESAGQVAS